MAPCQPGCTWFAIDGWKAIHGCEQYTITNQTMSVETRYRLDRFSYHGLSMYPHGTVQYKTMQNEIVYKFNRTKTDIQALCLNA